MTISYNWIDGIWIGTGSSGYNWDIRLEADTSQNRYTLEYPSLDGKSQLIFLDSHKQGEITFREKMLNGLNFSNNDIIIFNMVHNNKLTFSAYHQGETNCIGSGVLTKIIE
ncbi:unnamed protein product [Didymodactylos carnosus]|uniref:Uncharacterized protein n=1 Tax=Didymodactylos carnosus TaxID=1234261 RepID=A0A814NWS5_9BILA|nr:unnamed protein product [Didymodactylos carnosus]CAF3863472.1 unnamed protein product [Didymodactylos carnosus]